VLVILVCIWVK